MNLRRLTARTAAAGVTAALAASALVGLTSTTASAATAANAYTCTNPILGEKQATLTVSGELPVPQYWAGAPVPPDLLKITASVDDATQALLHGAGATSAKIADFAFKFSTGKVPVPLSGAVDGTTGAWAGKGSNLAFVTPAPGNVSAIMPSSLTFDVTTAAFGTQTLKCTLKSGDTAQAVASIKLLRQASATSAPKAVKAKKGKAAKFTAKVTSTSLTAPVTSGKVVAKEGKKVVGSGKLNSKGAAVVKLTKKLKKGKHKITVVYAGTPSIKGSSAKSVVTVK